MKLLKVTFTDKQTRRIDEMAKKLGVSRSGVISRSLRAYEVAILREEHGWQRATVDANGAIATQKPLLPKKGDA